MVLHLTKKLAEKLKVSIQTAETVTDEFFSWRANYIQDGRFRFVVFMNDASRFTVVINDVNAAKLKKLPELFFDNLRKNLLALGVDSKIVERYLADLGEITYSKNSDRKKTSQLNENAKFALWTTEESRDELRLSAFANRSCYTSTTDNSKLMYPNKKIIELLERYGSSVRNQRAFDLEIRLCLDRTDAVRCLRVPANITFEELHELLQVAFEWDNYHLYSFGLFKKWSKNRNNNEADIVLVENSDEFYMMRNVAPIEGVRLSDYLPEYTKILYTYDFGDDWHHYIEVKNIIDNSKEKLPVLLSGEGDSPPEDVGGPYGFANFLEIISNSKHEQYKEMMEWAKMQDWKPFKFEWIARRIEHGL